MNANLINAINALASVNPAMIATVSAVAATSEDQALKLAQTLLGQGAPQAASVVSQPTSYSQGAPVVVPFDGAMLKCFVLGMDLKLNGSINDGWYVCLIVEEGHKFFDSYTAYPVEMIWPDTEAGRLACQKKAADELAAAAEKKADKESHKLDLLASLPLSDDALTALSAQDKNSLLSLLGLNPFEIKGDRVPHLKEGQAAFLKTKEGKEKVAQAKAVSGYNHNKANAAAKPANKVVVKTPASVPAKVAAKIAPVLRKAPAPAATPMKVKAPVPTKVPAKVAKK